MPDAILLSRRTLATIKGNLIWAFGYNAATAAEPADFVQHGGCGPGRRAQRA